MQVSTTLCRGFSQAYCDRRQFSLVHLSLLEVAVFVIKELRDLHCVNELKNFATNIFLKLVCKPHIRIRASIGLLRTRSCALKGEIVTTEQVQLGIRVKVQL